jgi:hypothetical protein
MKHGFIPREATDHDLVGVEPNHRWEQSLTLGILEDARATLITYGHQ